MLWILLTIWAILSVLLFCLSLSSIRLDIRRYGSLSSPYASRGNFPMVVFGYAVGLMTANFAVAYFQVRNILNCYACFQGGYSSLLVWNIWEGCSSLVAMKEYMKIIAALHCSYEILSLPLRCKVNWSLAPLTFLSHLLPLVHRLVSLLYCTSSLSL